MARCLFLATLSLRAIVHLVAYFFTKLALTPLALSKMTSHLNIGGYLKACRSPHPLPVFKSEKMHFKMPFWASSRE